jgi:hypothetical protein
MCSAGQMQGDSHLHIYWQIKTRGTGAKPSTFTEKTTLNLEVHAQPNNNQMCGEVKTLSDRQKNASDHHKSNPPSHELLLDETTCK